MAIVLRGLAFRRLLGQEGKMLMTGFVKVMISKLVLIQRLCQAALPACVCFLGVGSPLTLPLEPPAIESSVVPSSCCRDKYLTKAPEERVGLLWLTV